MRRAAVALLTAAALIPAPAAARTPGPSLFGLNTGTFDPNYAHYVRDLPAARALGAPRRWPPYRTAGCAGTARGAPAPRSLGGGRGPMGAGVASARAGAIPASSPPLAPAVPHGTALPGGGRGSLDWRGELIAT